MVWFVYIFFFNTYIPYPPNLCGTMQQYHIVTFTFLMPADYSTCSATFSNVVTSSLHPHCQTGDLPVLRSVRLMSLG